MTAPRLFATSAVLVLTATGCARCAPGKVSQGVSRLTIRNFGAIGSLVADDTTCGFAAEAVLANPVVRGTPGSDGTVTWNVSNCQIDIPAATPFESEDCNGSIYTISGRVVVSGSKTVFGMVTGNADSPIIPGGPDAAAIQIDSAEFEDFVVKSSISPNFLTMKSGRISGILAPRLAVDNDVGACSVPTKHVLFTDIRYEPSKLHVDTESRSFDVDVDWAEIGAVHGKIGDRENALWGTMAVWGTEHEVPRPGDTDGLDPDYDPEMLQSSFACEPDIARPTTFDCSGFLAPRLAQSASRLSIRLLARVARVLDQDTRCGFASPTVQATAGQAGMVGKEGSVVLVANSCEIDFPTPTVIKTDCLGVESIVRGKLVVSGVKRLSGRVTGNPQTPVVPMDDSPAEIDVVVERFEDFEVIESGTAFRLMNGSFRGRIVPRTARDDASSGACAFASDIARFTDVEFTSPVDAVLKSSAGQFGVRIAGASLDAVTGTWGDSTNRLDGNIEIDGETWTLPADPADDGLTPDYDPAAFAAAWQCETVSRPISHDCRFASPLAQGASQLSIQMIGKLAGLLDADETCGFSSPSVISRPAITGELGRDGGRAVYTVDRPCEIRLPPRTELERDCNGKGVYASGTVRLTGTKTIEGIVSGHPIDAIVPTRSQPARLGISATFEEFSLWADPEVNKLTVHSGRVSGVVMPKLGIDTQTGACSIATAVATFEDVQLQNADVTVTKDGLQFRLSVPSASLSAQNGSARGLTNHLAGEIVVDGEHFDIPVAGAPVLDPDYEPNDFARSFACTPNLRVPDEETECNMQRVLGEGVARMLAMTAGTVASQVNGNDDCGFEDFFVKINPSRVTGDTGDMGELEWAITGCNIDRPTGGDPVDRDCFGQRRYMTGRVDVDATRTVSGRRVSEYWIFDSIVPITHDSVQIALDHVGLDRVEIYEVAPNATEAFRAIRFEEGQLSAVVMPIVGENAGEPGRYDVATPVAFMSDIRLSDAPVTLYSEGKTFEVFVRTANLRAFNGSWGEMGMTNTLQGSIVVDGTQIDIDGALNPTFEQRAFDASYTCDSELMRRIPPN